MTRSLKKGPYIYKKLEDKVLAMNESGKKVVVKTWARASMISPISWAIPSQFIMVTSLSLFTSRRTWLDTSSASLLPPVLSAATQATGNKLHVYLK